jgi:hypothetical protein
MREGRGRGLDEGGGGLRCAVSQARRDLRPSREGADVERGGGGAGLEECLRHLGGATREPRQPEADAGPFAETLLAQAFLQRARRFGEALGQRGGDPAKLGCVMERWSSMSSLRAHAIAVWHALSGAMPVATSFPA